MIAGALMLAVSLSGAPAAVAQDAGATPVALQEELAELTMEETLLLPQVPQKQKPYIKEYMLREARALQKLGYTVETMRQGGRGGHCAVRSPFPAQRHHSDAVGRQ